MTAAWAAALALLGGASCMYLAAQHQALLMGVVQARRWLRAGGGVLLAVALVLLLTVQGPATAVFTWVTWAMLVWSVVPVVIRWWRFRREVTK